MPANLLEKPPQCTPPDHWMHEHHYYLKSSKYKQLLSQRYGIMFRIPKREMIFRQKKKAGGGVVKIELLKIHQLECFNMKGLQL